MHERRSALPWIRRDDYGDVRKIMEDGETWSDTYDQWLEVAVAQERDIAEQGGEAERVIIEPWEFEVWCAAMGLAKNNAARLQFAAENASASSTSDARLTPTNYLS